MQAPQPPYSVSEEAGKEAASEAAPGWRDTLAAGDRYQLPVQVAWPCNLFRLCEPSASKTQLTVAIRKFHQKGLPHPSLGGQ